MNPTGKNISSDPQWTGIRAPRLGTKNVWKIFVAVKIISQATYEKIKSMKINDWTPEFSQALYEEIADHKVYITNLAKCTQIDARPLKDSVFKEYLQYTLQEIQEINPKYIITLGNQVSSILLGRPIKVSDYAGNEHELLTIKTTPTHRSTTHRSIVPLFQYKVYPTFYPVGQGTRNMPAAIERIKNIG